MNNKVLRRPPIKNLVQIISFVKMRVFVLDRHRVFIFPFKLLSKVAVYSILPLEDFSLGVTGPSPACGEVV